VLVAPRPRRAWQRERERLVRAGVLSADHVTVPYRGARALRRPARPCPPATRTPLPHEQAAGSGATARMVRVWG